MTYLKLSPTKAATWVDCPRRYFHKYVERRRSDRVWAHSSLGLSVHAALREWFDLPSAERLPDSVAALVARVWIDAGFRDREQSDEWRARAVQMVGSYVSPLDPEFQPFSTERTLAFKTEHFIMEGRVDRIDESASRNTAGSVFEVIDYKTGKSIPSTDDVRGSQALAMYALMVQRTLGKNCLKVSLHHLPSGAGISWTHTTDSLQRHLSRVASIATDIRRALDTWEGVQPADPLVRDELFPARASALCGFCDHWEVCDTGRNFTKRKESWEGLAIEGV